MTIVYNALTRRFVVNGVEVTRQEERRARRYMRRQSKFSDPEVADFDPNGALAQRVGPDEWYEMQREHKRQKQDSRIPRGFYR